MAGFFGLFDFTKEGPGVDKNAPKKKRVIIFFEVFFRNFLRFIPLNIICSLLSAPILTHGIASAGVTNVARNIAREKHSFGLSDYFETIRKNFKQSMTVGIINTCVTILLLYFIWFYNESYKQTSNFLFLMGFVICLTGLTIFNFMKYYIYTLMISFKYNIKTIYKNSFKFVFLNLWRNILCGLILLIVYAIYVVIFLLLPTPIVLTIELFVLLISFPTFKFMLIQFLTFDSIKKHIIDPYYEQHPYEDIEQRKNLGLEVPDNDVDEPISWE